MYIKINKLSYIMAMIVDVNQDYNNTQDNLHKLNQTLQCVNDEIFNLNDQIAQLKMRLEKLEKEKRMLILHIDTLNVSENIVDDMKYSVVSHSLRRGNYVIIKGRACKILNIEYSK